MFIMRWLMTRPIAFVWALTILALLLGYRMDSGEDHSEATEQHVAAENAVKTEEMASASDDHSALIGRSSNESISTEAEKIEAKPADDSSHEVVSTESETEAETIATEETTATVSDATVASETKEPTITSAEAVPTASHDSDATNVAVEEKSEDVVVASTTEVAPSISQDADVINATMTTEQAESAVTESVIDQAKETEVKAAQATAVETVAVTTDQAEETSVDASTEQVTVAQQVTANVEPAVGASEGQVAAETSVAEVVTAETEAASEQTAEQIATEQAATQAQAAVTAQAVQPLALAPADLLRYARGAYWAGDLNSSVQYYQQLVEQQPDIIDYQGELANVYWRQGASDKAAALYADMALPMIKMGKTQQVKTMNVFIGQYLPEKAKEIAAKLQP